MSNTSPYERLRASVDWHKKRYRSAILEVHMDDADAFCELVEADKRFSDITETLKIKRPTHDEAEELFAAEEERDSALKRVMEDPHR